MKKMICPLALALAVASLVGCGLKGPLYFPKEAPAASGTPASHASSSDGQDKSAVN